MSREAAPLESASWTVLAPVPANGSVLWVGPARESQLQHLSLIFGRLSAVDLESRDGAAEAWDRLAVPDRSIDLAVVAGVLGDVSRWAPGARPREAWLSLLRALHAKIKPGGHIFVAAENRWAISRALALGAGRRPVRASLRGYRAALIRVGFSAIRMWYAFPDCEDPKFLVECRQPVFDHFLRVLAPRARGAKRRAVRGAVNAVGALKYTARWYWILGRRDVAGG